MTKAIYALVLILSLANCRNNSLINSDGANGNWQIFRGDAGLTGYSQVRLPDRLELLWKFKSDSRTSSSPVVYNNTAYWCDKRGKIYGVNAGKQVFDYNFNTAVEASPMISDSVLYIGRIDGIMCAISLSTSDTLWTFETQGQISASPNVGVFKGREAVVFGSYDNFLYCVNKHSGNEITRFPSGYYINGAVAVMDNYFFSGGCDAWLRIIDGEVGVATDSLELDTYIPASPSIDGHSCYIADHSGNVYCLTINDGKITSHKKIFEAEEQSGAFISVPAISESLLYFLSDTRSLYAIDRKSGAVRWKYLQKGSSGESSPLICLDKVVSCTKSGVVSILDAADGSLLWEYDTGEQIIASPASANACLYILTSKGSLFCFGNPTVN
jgi:outer membrane protein assembly factor BamB